MGLIFNNFKFSNINFQLLSYGSYPVINLKSPTMEIYSAATVSMFYINYGCSDMEKRTQRISLPSCCFLEQQYTTALPFAGQIHRQPRAALFMASKKTLEDNHFKTRQKLYQCLTQYDGDNMMEISSDIKYVWIRGTSILLQSGFGSLKYS